MKPQSLLPDAMIVIDLHRLGLWREMCEHYEVIVPSIIAHEAHWYWDPELGQRCEIDLQAEASAGRIRIAEASAEQMNQLLTLFDCLMQGALHPGEQEALALLYARQIENCWGCSADQAAVKALILLEMGQAGASLERALQEAGLLNRAGKLDGHCTEACYQRWVNEARVDRIQGRGLARSLF